MKGAVINVLIGYLRQSQQTEEASQEAATVAGLNEEGRTFCV